MPFFYLRNEIKDVWIVIGLPLMTASAVALWFKASIICCNAHWHSSWLCNEQEVFLCRFSCSMLHRVLKFHQNWSVCCPHLFFVWVHQEGAGSLRPVQLHHGGGCPSGPAFLWRGCIWKQWTLQRSFSTTARSSPRVASSDRAFRGASSGGRRRPKLQQKPPSQRLWLLSPINLLILLPLSRRDCASSSGALLLFVFIMG